MLHLIYGNKGNKKCDITSDNEAVRGVAYQSGYTAGEASVDVTTNDAAIRSVAYNQGFSEGAASVDVTTNDAAIRSVAYNQGFSEGAASVDVTTNDAAIRSAAYNQGYSDYQTENGINGGNKCTFYITRYQTKSDTPTTDDIISYSYPTQLSRNDVRTYWMGPTIKSGTNWLRSSYKIEALRNDPTRYDCYVDITRPSTGADNNWNFPTGWNNSLTLSTEGAGLPNDHSGSVVLYNATSTRRPDIITLYAKQTRTSS